jgi:hypothetical protein
MFAQVNSKAGPYSHMRAVRSSSKVKQRSWSSDRNEGSYSMVEGEDDPIFDRCWERHRGGERLKS